MAAKFASDQGQHDLACNHGKTGSCSTCRLADLCIPIALEIEDVNKLESIVNRGKPMAKGDHIYREDEQFKSVYAVRLGSVKTYRMTGDGKEQVTGFYMAGEVFGVDGVANGIHENSAVALDTSAICAIPFERLEELSTLIPSLQRHIFKLLGHEIAEDQKLITLLSKNSADERLAALFLGLSQRCSTIGLSSTNIILPMSRGDIANYLGLTVETVSRVLSRLQKQKIIEIDNKELNILDMDALRNITANCDV